MRLVELPEVAGWAVVILGGGADVHHVHLWQMQEHAAVLDCHVVLHRDA